MTSLRARRDAVHDRLDRAQAALLKVHAARNIPTSWPKGLEVGDDQRRSEWAFGSTTSALEHLNAATVEAKAALADIVQYVPEADAWVRKEWELDEKDYPQMRRTIDDRRAAALATERLFRSRAVLNTNP